MRAENDCTLTGNSDLIIFLFGGVVRVLFEQEPKQMNRSSGLMIALLVIGVSSFGFHRSEAHESEVQTVDIRSLPKQWQPKQPVRRWKYLIVHHSASERGSVESIDRYHKSRKDANGNPWKGIGYHFVIGNGNGLEDGTIEPTFRWRGQLSGAHAGVREYNDFGIGICLIGNFEQKLPTQRQQESLKQLLLALTQTFQVDSEQILRHGQIRQTACPGKLIPLKQWVKQWLKD